MRLPFPFYIFAKKRVAIGSLWDARRIASRATLSSTPSISYRIRPGLTTATQNSGPPFPLPIRVSAGFLETGLSGKIRIQTLPPRRTWRVIAIRPASICRLVIHAGSRACNAYCPKLISFPRLALPLILPRCCLRNFVFFGINMAQAPLVSGVHAYAVQASQRLLRQEPQTPLYKSTPLPRPDRRLSSPQRNHIRYLHAACGVAHSLHDTTHAVPSPPQRDVPTTQYGLPSHQNAVPR